MSVKDSSESIRFGVFESVKGRGENYENPWHVYAPVGRSFFNYIYEADEVPAETPAPGKEATKTNSAHEEEDTTELSLEDDYYTLLGLKDLSFRSSQADIKRGYRRAVLKHHPDKKSNADENEDGDPLFLKIQKAYETLSNTKQRQVYDSSLEFDDYVPSGREDLSKVEGGFYGLYGPIFESNARFSTIRPVPSLGNDGSDDDDVEAFYSFWLRFSSWREIKGKDEHDISDADSRDERRWMQQENERKRKKLKKSEMERVRALVNNARDNDPRVARIKESARLQREERKRKKREAIEAKKEAERLEKEAKEAEAARIAAEEKARRIAVRDAKSKVKKMRRKIRRKINAMSEKVEGGSLIDPEDVAYLVDRLSIPELEAVVGGVNADALPEVEACVRRVAELFKKEEEKEVEEARQRKEKELEDRRRAEEERAALKLAKSKAWSDKERDLLIKGLKKFPGGTRLRWKKIAEFVNNVCNKNRTPKYCINKAHELDSMKSMKQKIDSKVAFERSVNLVKEGKGSAEGESEVEWTAEQQKLLQSAIKKFPSSMSKKERWVAIAKCVPGKTFRDCVLRVKQIREAIASSKRP
eukprot:g3346.t1